LKNKSLVLVAALLLSACSFGVEHVPPLSAPEQYTLSRAENGDNDAAHALFMKSLDKNLDDGAADQYSEELTEFLQRVGQDKFFSAWQREQPAVRNAVANWLDGYLRTTPDLYPLLRKMSAIDGTKL